MREWFRDDLQRAHPPQALLLVVALGTPSFVVTVLIVAVIFPPRVVLVQGVLFVNASSFISPPPDTNKEPLDTPQNPSSL